MRILSVIDAPREPSSGAAGTVFFTNQALRELGHEVDEVWSHELARRIRHGNLHSLLEQPVTLRAAIRSRVGRIRYDVIQVSQPQAWLAAREHKRRKLPGIFVNRSHGVELRARSSVRYWREKLNQRQHSFLKNLLSAALTGALDRQWPAVAGAADGIVVSSRQDREFLVSNLGVSPSRVRAIAEGVTGDLLSTPPLPLNSSRLRRLLYVGQTAFIKGTPILAQAVNELLVGAPGCSFTWVCSAEHHAFCRSLLNPAIHARVTLLDWMPHTKLGSIYDRHGIFLFPSFFEGFGKAPLEAMARGMCVVASATGGMKDYVASGENGNLVPVGHVSPIVEEVRHLLADHEYSRRLAHLARVTAEQHTWRACASKMVDFYRFLQGDE